jgi:hypothetical protein
MDVGLRSRELVCNRGQRLRPVDQDPDIVARARRRPIRWQSRTVRIECVLPSNLTQSAPVVCYDRAVDRSANRPINREERVRYPMPKARK